MIVFDNKNVTKKSTFNKCTHLINYNIQIYIILCNDLEITDKNSRLRGYGALCNYGKHIKK